MEEKLQRLLEVLIRWRPTGELEETTASRLQRVNFYTFMASSGRQSLLFSFLFVNQLFLLVRNPEKGPYPPKKGQIWWPKKWKWGPPKKTFPESIWTRTFCKKTDPNWSFLASAAPFTIYTPPIGGSHRVLDFTTQITEKYSTAMCYCWQPWMQKQNKPISRY